MAPLEALRAPWPGQKIDLHEVSAKASEAISPTAKLLRQRHSTRSFDDGRPITLAEVARFLDGTARVLLTWSGRSGRRRSSRRTHCQTISVGGSKL
jgi:hypothetical protein